MSKLVFFTFLLFGSSVSASIAISPADFEKEYATMFGEKPAEVWNCKNDTCASYPCQTTCGSSDCYSASCSAD